MMFNKKDEEIVFAFLKREREDFLWRKETEEMKEKWVKAAYEKISELLKEKSYINITILSLGNAGCAMRSLSLDVNTVNGADWQKMKYGEVILCNCGCVKDISISDKQ